MFISFNEVQYAKADSPILVTLSGMSIFSNEVQPSKAEASISVTPLGDVYLF